MPEHTATEHPTHARPPSRMGTSRWHVLQPDPADLTTLGMALRGQIRPNLACVLGRGRAYRHTQDVVVPAGDGLIERRGVVDVGNGYSSAGEVTRLRADARSVSVGDILVRSGTGRAWIVANEGFDPLPRRIEMPRLIDARDIRDAQNTSEAGDAESPLSI